MQAHFARAPVDYLLHLTLGDVAPLDAIDASRARKIFLTV
jgi:hypothetical protein